MPITIERNKGPRKGVGFYPAKRRCGLCLFLKKTELMILPFGKTEHRFHSCLKHKIACDPKRTACGKFKLDIKKSLQYANRNKSR